jgi:hypothetical protein
MPVICEAAVELLEPDVDDVPPCQAWRIQELSIRCGVPSSFCVYISCTCGERGSYFLCGEDFWRVKYGFAQCGACKTPITKWQEI